MSKCLFDTNIISEILKQNLSIRTGTIASLIESNQIVVPLISIAELSETDDLLDKLVDFSLSHRVLISKSSRMIFEDELDNYKSKKSIDIQLIDLTESVLDDETHMRNYFRSDEFISAVDGLNETEDTALDNLNTISIYDFNNRKDYMKAYLKTRLMTKTNGEFQLDENDDGLSHFRSISLQGAFLYYKYITKGVKIKHSDPFDGLMIPTLPFGIIYGGIQLWLISANFSKLSHIIYCCF